MRGILPNLNPKRRTLDVFQQQLKAFLIRPPRPVNAGANANTLNTAGLLWPHKIAIFDDMTVDAHTAPLLAVKPINQPVLSRVDSLSFKPGVIHPRIIMPMRCRTNPNADLLGIVLVRLVGVPENQLVAVPRLPLPNKNPSLPADVPNAHRLTGGRFAVPNGIHQAVSEFHKMRSMPQNRRELVGDLLGIALGLLQGLANRHRRFLAVGFVQRIPQHVIVDRLNMPVQERHAPHPGLDALHDHRLIPHDLGVSRVVNQRLIGVRVGIGNQPVPAHKRKNMGHVRLAPVRRSAGPLQCRVLLIGKGDFHRHRLRRQGILACPPVQGLLYHCFAVHS